MCSGEMDREWRSVATCFGEFGIIWNLIWWETGSCLHATAEVEEGDQSCHIPDRTFTPACALEFLHVVFFHQTRCLSEFARIAEKRSSLVIEIVLGPRRCELMAEMLILRQAANCRRMETQSRSAADLPVDDRCQHLALDSSE